MKNKNGRTVLNTKEKKEILFHGIPASPGIAIGPVRLAGIAAPAPLSEKNQVANFLKPDQVEAEVALFTAAIERTKTDIQALRDTLDSESAEIFDAHLMIVNDKMLFNEVVALIREKYLTAESAFRETIERYIAAISNMPDQYLRERAVDIRDVSTRILDRLNGLAVESISQPDNGEPVIIIARDLTPSDTASMNRSHVLGFAIETGSPTSHTAILARSMHLPAVVGMQRLIQRLADGDQIIIDGYIGMVIIHPNEETIAFYQEKLARQERLYAELQKENKMSAETTDGYKIHLAANVEGIENLDELQKYGTDGIGLYRTEYLFLNQSVLPDEETQFQVYRELAEKMQGQPVIIRTLDVGGDKLSSVLSVPNEPNPFLGLRAVRLCLSHPELMRTQMRALLRAGIYGNIKMMFPMISSMSELDTLLSMLESVKNDLMSRQQSFNGHMDVGVMLEIPAAVLIADQLAKKVDFFSIGSNDLVQYTLAVDRGNEKVAYLYNPMHPAVIELIARAAKAAHDNHIWIGCCGEMAGDPQYTPLLVGLGIQELSMSPSAIAPVRRIIRRMSMLEAEQLTAAIREKADPVYAVEQSQKLVARLAPDIAKMNKGF